MNCILLPHRTDLGTANMALDEALLEAVSENPTSAIFRTYEWSEPTLSLGYFQNVAEAKADPRFASVPLVRRCTGGGAIWHEHEVTYALILPRDHSLGRSPIDLYRTVHEAILGLLNDPEGQGRATRRGAGIPKHQQPGLIQNLARRPFLCFTDCDPEDIVMGSVKIVGSAQRRKPGAILQHGSILLRGARRTPELPGLSDITGLDAGPRFWVPRLQEAIPRALKLPTQFMPYAQDVCHRALELERTVYGEPGWTNRR